MTPWLVLAAAGGVTWLLRVTFIDLIPARKLPAAVREALEAGGPAALAALLTSEVLGGSANGGMLAAALVGVAAAALVTWRLGNLGLTVLAGVGCYWLATAVL